MRARSGVTVAVYLRHASADRAPSVLQRVPCGSSLALGLHSGLAAVPLLAAAATLKPWTCPAAAPAPVRAPDAILSPLYLPELVLTQSPASPPASRPMQSWQMPATKTQNGMHASMCSTLPSRMIYDST